jgi:hypothetical protein
VLLVKISVSKKTKKNVQNDLQRKNNEDSKKQQNEKTDDFNEWKRLEKWKIGRRNFC